VDRPLQSSRRRRHSSGFVVGLMTLIVVLVMGASAYGASDTRVSSAASALGAPNPAKGTPVTIGVITEGGSQAIATQSALTQQGATIAVKYINQYLNGIAGHVVQLYVCGNNSTPAGGQQCANQMVQRHVVAVTLPFTGQGPAEVPIITGAGIPYVTLSGASTQELMTPGSFALTGGFPAILGATALHAKQHGFSKVTMLVSDVPSAIQGAQALGGIAFKAAGVGYSVIPVENGTPDMTPQVQAAISGGAGAIGIVGDVTLCTSFLKAYQTLNVKVPKYVLTTCIDPTIIRSLGAELAGSYVGTTSAVSNDVKIYAAMVGKYSHGVNPNPLVSTGVGGGVTAVMAFRAMMQGLTGDVTPATVTQQLKTATNVPLFLGGGITMTCNGMAIPLLPSICSATTQVGTLTSNGLIKNLKLYDAAPLFKG
jgi:branched-chain amino acid transport system substrate-binding protein